MDPLTLIALLGGALAAGGVASEMKRPPLPDIIVRTAWKQGALELVELRSYGALEEVGLLFDLDLHSWAPACRSGFTRAFVLVDLTGGEGRHVVFRARAEGSLWKLDAAFTQGQGRASPAQVMQIETALHALAGSTAPSLTDMGTSGPPLLAPPADIPVFTTTPETIAASR